MSDYLILMTAHFVREVRVSDFLTEIIIALFCCSLWLALSECLAFFKELHPFNFRALLINFSISRLLR